MIVGLMAAILFVLAVPGVRRSIESTRLQTSAKELETEMSFARSMSISRNSAYQININQEERTFQIVDPYSSSRPRAERRLEEGVFFQKVPDTPITFFPRGHARGGVILLGNSYAEIVRIGVRSSGMAEMTHYNSDETSG